MRGCMPAFPGLFADSRRSFRTICENSGAGMPCNTMDFATPAGKSATFLRTPNIVVDIESDCGIWQTIWRLPPKDASLLHIVSALGGSYSVAHPFSMQYSNMRRMVSGIALL